MHGEKFNAYRVWWESHEEGDYYEYLSVGRRIMLKWVPEK
jgi:hypothetical protein